ncbi:PAN domain-containing protein [Acanthamoeba polyphaga moumouvirus]|uniref:PAN domain-containing protein n=1 Tax=Acanthamoeba polyphaga moumouvirus TaxID=1269028 RepID=L7RC65_9VIRU|nr:PAN domain-containing protein [Acanthamoeba polyphaga moumouvirus]AGC01862.1 PAN domain-containing protein [Acanthamoeba polyphaga moumouvirus]AQN68221.1 PAn domain protein [Saudi moumouvirus]
MSGFSWFLLVVSLLILLSLLGLAGYFIYREFNKHAPQPQPINPSGIQPVVPSGTNPNPNPSPGPNPNPSPNPNPNPNPSPSPSPNPAQCQGFSIIQNIDIPVTPLGGSGTQSSEANCQALCNNNPNCNFYSYDSLLNFCALSEGTPSNTIVTGFKNNIRNNSDCPTWSRVNINIPGFTTSTHDNTSEQQCQQLCQTNNCDWYSHDGNNNTCTLNMGTSINQFNTGFKIR